MSLSAEEILNSPDYMYCEKFKLKMHKKHCPITELVPLGPMGYIRETHTACLSCERNGGKGKVIVVDARPKKIRGKKGMSFHALAREEGFLDEGEMLRYLIKDMSYKGIALFLGVSKSSVQKRVYKYGAVIPGHGRKRAPKPFAKKKRR